MFYLPSRRGKTAYIAWTATRVCASTRMISELPMPEITLYFAPARMLRRAQNINEHIGQPQSSLTAYDTRLRDRPAYKLASEATWEDSK